MRSEAPSACPLFWPAGWPRVNSASRRDAPFAQTKDRGSYRSSEPIGMTAARERLQREIDLLKASEPILSSNVELRLDGMPRAGQPQPSDPGVAVYFQLRGKPVVLACDRWKTVAGNIAAVAAHINAMRGMARWGVGSVEQLFTGYLALPQPSVPPAWRAVLGNPADLDEAEATFRREMRVAHPDAGGSHERAAALTAAIAAARVHFRG